MALGRVGAVCRGETDCVHDGVVRVGAEGRVENASRLGGARKVGVPLVRSGCDLSVRTGALVRLPAGSITVTRCPPEVSYVRDKPSPRVGSLDHTERDGPSAGDADVGSVRTGAPAPAAAASVRCGLAPAAITGGLRCGSSPLPGEAVPVRCGPWAVAVGICGYAPSDLPPGCESTQWSWW